jgi:hypothetical protein
MAMRSTPLGRVPTACCERLGERDGFARLDDDSRSEATPTSREPSIWRSGSTAFLKYCELELAIILFRCNWGVQLCNLDGVGTHVTRRTLLKPARNRDHGVLDGRGNFKALGPGGARRGRADTQSETSARGTLNRRSRIFSLNSIDVIPQRSWARTRSAAYVRSVINQANGPSRWYSKRNT